MANRDLSPSPTFHHPPPPPSYLLHNATIVDVAGEEHARLIKSTTVAVQNGIVASVAPLEATGGIAAPTTSRPGRTVIDCTGLYLCPGLVADFQGRRISGRGVDDEDRGQHHFFHHDNDEMAVETAVRNAHSARKFCAGLLRRGVTSVRDLGGIGNSAVDGGHAVSSFSSGAGGNHPGLTLGSPAALRDAVDSGVFPGPRLFVSEAGGRVLARRRGSVAKRGRGGEERDTAVVRAKKGDRKKGRNSHVGSKRRWHIRDNKENEDEHKNAHDDFDDERTHRIIATAGKGDRISECVQAVREELLVHRRERRDFRQYGRGDSRRVGVRTNTEEDFLKIVMRCSGEGDDVENELFSTAEIAAIVECAGEEGEGTYIVAEVVVDAASPGKGALVGEAVRRCALGGVRGIVVVLAGEGGGEGMKGFLMEEDEDGETVGEVLSREGVGFTIIFTGQKRGSVTHGEEKKDVVREDEEGSGGTDGYHLFEEQDNDERPATRQGDAKDKRSHDIRIETLQAASEAGVTICFGMQDGLRISEFGLRAKATSPEEILRSATINPAAMLGRENDLGQIREGFEADILFLSKDPLEDISILDDPERYIKGVMKGGRIYKLGSFDALGGGEGGGGGGGGFGGAMRRIRSLL